MDGPQHRHGAHPHEGVCASGCSMLQLRERPSHGCMGRGLCHLLLQPHCTRCAQIVARSIGELPRRADVDAGAAAPGYEQLYAQQPQEQYQQYQQEQYQQPQQQMQQQEYHAPQYEQQMQPPLPTGGAPFVGAMTEPPLATTRNEELWRDLVVSGAPRLFVGAGGVGCARVVLAQ